MTTWRDYIFYEDEHLIVLNGDTRQILPLMEPNSVQLVPTSPPYYGLRDYGTAEWEGGSDDCDHSEKRGGFGAASTKQTTSNGTQNYQYRDTCPKCGATRIDSQIGSEQTPREFIEVMLAVFEDVKKVIHPSGGVVLNLGDSYWGSGKGLNPDGTHSSANKPTDKQFTNKGALKTKVHKYRTDLGFKDKDKMLIPHRTAIALCDEGGWWIRQEFPWVKRNPMPSSTTDRAGTATETMFHLAKRARYFWDETAVRVSSKPESDARMLRGVGGSHKNVAGAPGQSPHSMNRPRPHIKNVDPANWNGSSFTKGKTAGHQKGTMQSEASRAARDRSNGNRNGEGGHLDDTPAGSRGFRNADLWYQSTEKPHGLVGVGDEITGIDVNPAGFSGEFCTACDRYYHNAKDKKAIRVEKQEDGSEKRFCLCGRSDKWLSHFATFPQALIEPFIKAGTSEHGQCVECKAPYEREVEKTGQLPGRERNVGGRDDGYARPAQWENRQNPTTTETIGWSKTCKCPTDEREPQTVLDIFGGAGTTAIAARRLGRKCILIELNPEYCKLIVARYKREFEDTEAVQASPAAESYAMPLFV